MSGRPMDQPVEKTVFAPRSNAAAGGNLFNAGDVVGQYKIERVLGQGGMGVVYLALHTALKKKFAIKVLPAHLAQEKQFVKRFTGEAEMVAKLKDAHIVNVTDFGESNGKLYLVLEYVDGGTLEDWFKAHVTKDGGLPAAEVARITGQILKGLSHAHKAGIIHRDLKPANVLMEKMGEAKISDFGLARMAAEEDYKKAGGTYAPFGAGDSVTTTGAIVGTIDYMSPEARNSRPSDARSDIWTMGIIIYYLLTGKKPSGLAKNASQLIPGLDPRWDKLISTCLADEPGQRFQTADDVMAALQELTAKPASGASHDTTPWFMPVVAVTLLVVGGFVIWKFLVNKKPPETPPVQPVAVAPAVPAKTEPEQTRPVVKEPEPSKPEPAAPRRLTLTGLPPNAQVFHNNRTYTVSGAGQLTLSGAAGSPWVIKVKADGYQDWDGEVGQDPATLEEAVHLQLVPPHSVRFTGLPPGAKVVVNNDAVTADANGNASFELRPSRLIVTATLPKWKDFAQEVDIQQSTQTVPLAMEKVPPPAEVVVDLGAGGQVKFKWIPPGEFQVGTRTGDPGQQRSDLPFTRTEIKAGFYMAETEMTQRQHQGLVGRNPSSSRALGDDSRPVEQVAWRDITGGGGVIERLNTVLQKQSLEYKADLPTEVEWEYACRAGTESSFNDGHNFAKDGDDPALDTIAHYMRGAGLREAAPTAKLKPNAWGLYDMHGNVAEWAYGIKGKRDAVLRGGHFKMGAVHCRSASRIELQPDARPTDYMGYRLILRPVEQ
ncbi:MAG TPA: protein kinase [Lacunisphaera sp.]|nr:protein kinase [Lacunisphaera sp.]